MGLDVGTMTLSGKAHLCFTVISRDFFFIQDFMKMSYKMSGFSLAQVLLNIDYIPSTIGRVSEDINPGLKEFGLLKFR